jgi:ABC-type multidrug transport system ATPase subunit
MIVEARSVSKRFGQRIAVDGLDLDVPQGLCFGLL